MKKKIRETTSKPLMIPDPEGILPIDKPSGLTAFSLVRKLRRLLGVKTIGHAGTLDPFATGVMVMLIGRPYTKLSDQLMGKEKEYCGRIKLGVVTDTYDSDGIEVEKSTLVPSLEDVEKGIACFQGEVEQIPPMYSAKKINGQKLYELARKGKTVERKPVKLFIQTELIAYEYPYVDIQVTCSKGTYIRSIAYDLGNFLGCGAHLSSLARTRSGGITLSQCLDGKRLEASDLTLSELSSKTMKTASWSAIKA